MNKRFIHINCAFIGVAAIVILVWLFCYKQNDCTELLEGNAYWINYGQLFIGLCTLLVTIVTAYVTISINVQLHRSEMTKIYEERMKKLRDVLNNNIKNISPKELESAYMDMQIGVGMIMDNDSFSYSVRKNAKELFNRISKFDIITMTSYLETEEYPKDVEEDYKILYLQLSNLVSELAGFVVCLVNNKV